MAKIEIDDEDLRRIVKEVVDEKFYSSCINKYTPGYSGRMKGGRIINYSVVHKDRHCMIPDTMVSEEFMNPPYDVLMKDIENLKAQNEVLKARLEETQINCDEWKDSYADKSKEYDRLNQAFEESARGDLMNLKLVRKYLDEICVFVKTPVNFKGKCEFLKAINIIDKDISNLDKFVEERWGHDEEE